MKINWLLKGTAHKYPQFHCYRIEWGNPERNRVSKTIKTQMKLNIFERIRSFTKLMKTKEKQQQHRKKNLIQSALASVETKQTERNK